MSFCDLASKTQSLYVKPFFNGVIIQSDTDDISHDEGIHLSELESDCFNAYIVSGSSITEWLNERNSRLCGYFSVSDAIGRVTGFTGSAACREQLIHHNATVINATKPFYFEENFINRDGELKDTVISYKLPWYDEQKKIKGILGLSAASVSCFPKLFLNNDKRLFHNEDLKKQANMINGIQFTSQEINCFKLVTRGFTCKEIAKYLNLSYRTVQNYIANAKEKIGINTKSELINFVSDHIASST